MQGFVPVILFRELLLRLGVLARRGGWTVTVLLFMVLGLSAAYELLEWLTAEATGSAADDFLGTQGDPWDTQWDMCCALIGGTISLLTLSRIHDRQLAAAPPPG
jgi:putative membrane protein